MKKAIPIFIIILSCLMILSVMTVRQKNKALGAAPLCDPTLWKHVYAGDPRRFSKPQDRLQVIKDCVTVTGVIETAKAEQDSDFHIQLKVDDKTLINSYNISGQKGYLVIEPICSQNPPKQRDTIEEKSCDGFSQHIFTKDMLGKKVKITGAWVKDMEHKWLEIHPVTSIEIQ